jgi:poly-gamma-glutamate synthesis protein (capsule biosynthesis protein)
MSRFVYVFLAILFIVAVVQPGFCQSKQADEISITFVGDVQPGVLERATQGQIDYIKKQFEGSDLVFGNLETPITTYSQLTAGKSSKAIKDGKDYAFKANPSSAKMLNAIGISVVGLANNHMMDYTDRGLLDTIKYLNKAGVAYCGAGENKAEAEAPVIVVSKKSGIKTAFIAYSEIAPLMSDATSKTPGIAYINYPSAKEDLDKMGKSIALAKKKGADIIVVTLHWGKEKSTVFESYQKELSKKLFEAGADCIIGHHPHVLRSIEKTGGKTIAYSLGNFIFDSYDRKTIVLNITFKKNGSGQWVQTVKTRPMYIMNGIPGK